MAQAQNSERETVVYSMKCRGSDKQYIVETARTLVLRMRFKEHTDGKHPNSAITEHTSTTGHIYTLPNVKVLVKEEGKGGSRHPQEETNPEQR